MKEASAATTLGPRNSATVQVSETMVGFVNRKCATIGKYFGLTGVLNLKAVLRASPAWRRNHSPRGIESRQRHAHALEKTLSAHVLITPAIRRRQIHISRPIRLKLRFNGAAKLRLLSRPVRNCERQQADNLPREQSASNQERALHFLTVLWFKSMEMRFGWWECCDKDLRIAGAETSTSSEKSPLPKAARLFQQKKRSYAASRFQYSISEPFVNIRLRSPLRGLT